MRPLQSTANFHPSRQSGSEHIGIIPDGTRRWAKKNNMPLRNAYDHAMNKLSYLLDSLYSEGVRAVSVYLSSAQNFRRTEGEIAAFCDAEAAACERLFLPLAKKFGVKVTTAGDLTKLSATQMNCFCALVSKTTGAQEKALNLCIAYDPIEEINRALSLQGGDGFMPTGLWISDPIDLVIRTGGANVLSNFLPLQTGFARLYFNDCLFNDLSFDDCFDILKRYRSINRLYGE